MDEEARAALAEFERSLGVSESTPSKGALLDLRLILLSFYLLASAITVVAFALLHVYVFLCLSRSLLKAMPSAAAMFVKGGVVGGQAANSAHSFPANASPLYSSSSFSASSTPSSHHFPSTPTEQQTRSTPTASLALPSSSNSTPSTETKKPTAFAFNDDDDADVRVFMYECVFFCSVMLL